MMKVKEFLTTVAEITNSNIKDDEKNKIYVSKFDKSYLTRVGMEKEIKFLADREITEELTHGVGYSPKDKKWYGWSHRAIYGFKIGSTCKKGDCHYKGRNLKELEEDAISFWTEKDHKNVKCTGIVKHGKDSFFKIEWKYSNKVPNKKIRNQIKSIEHYITSIGKGEWTAKSMKDAKQMAIDFNVGVS